MDILLPPTWVQNRAVPARIERMMLGKYFQSPGIVTTSALGVTAQGSPNMTVNVAAGEAWVAGTSVSNQGYYHVVNDSIVVLTINQSNTSSRTDIVVLRVYDSEYSGSFNTAQLEVITGTPGGGTPATPADSLKLATITVGANVTSISNANIVDNRVTVKSNNYLVQSWIQEVPWTLVTTYKSNFVAHASFTKPHYRVVGGDTLELCGLVVANTAIPSMTLTAMFTLPVFPQARAQLAAICGLGTTTSSGASAGTSHTHPVAVSTAEGMIRVETNGEVGFQPDAGFVSGEYISLDGIQVPLKE